MERGLGIGNSGWAWSDRPCECLVSLPLGEVELGVRVVGEKVMAGDTKNLKELEGPCDGRTWLTRAPSFAEATAGRRKNLADLINPL
jgi:hypothetical protein